MFACSRAGALLAFSIPEPMPGSGDVPDWARHTDLEHVSRVNTGGQKHNVEVRVDDPKELQCDCFQLL